jgi:NitT/TauT family transport system substrate-binding protein
MTYVNEPVWSQESGNYRMVWDSSKIAPRVTATVGILRTDYLTRNPDTIRAIIAARKKGVEYILKSPAESAAALAREYKIELTHARSAIDNILAGKGVFGVAADSISKAWTSCSKGCSTRKPSSSGLSTGLT